MSLNFNRFQGGVDGAFDWITRNLDFFNPVMDGARFDLVRAKAMVELICMCMFYNRSTPDHTDVRVQNFISFVYQVCQRPEFHDRLVRNPGRFRLFALPYVALWHCGIKDPGINDVIQRLVDQGYVTAAEVVPFRALDLRYMLDIGGFKHDLPSYGYLYSQTLLSKLPPLMNLSDEDAYSITHTLFYLSDFSLRPIEGIPEEQLETVRMMIGSLLGLYLRVWHLDLVAEFLLACRCLDWSPPYLFNISWQALLDAQLQDGSFPGPTFCSDDMGQLSESEQKYYCFDHNYHTTLISAMASFLSKEWICDRVSILAQQS